MSYRVTCWLIMVASLCEIAGQETEAIRFQAIDVFIDSGAQPLAAYQLTFVGPNGTKIVGVEGGHHIAFAEAPYYDPQAMQKEEVVVAAFTTAGADQLPIGRTRVATIHVRTDLKNTPVYKVDITAAAAPDGKQIQVRAEAQERNSK
jgi:hypothetical protein